MLSVTNRIKTVSQPQNGYVPKTLFSFKKYEDYKELKPIKSALASIQGLAVDYLSRFILSGDKMKSFNISLLGAAKVDKAYESDNATKNALSLLEHVTGLNQESAINVCKIVCYDAAYRAGLEHYQSPDEILFEDDLFDNVLILTERTLILLKDVGTIVNDGLTFEGGYTKLVDSGDIDYLTADTLIDLKVSKNDFSIKWSLQLLMYYILGIHSIHSEFLSIKKLCIVNPYLNQYCICNIAKISNESKYKVSNNVLGYKMVYEVWSYNKNSEFVYNYSKWRKVDGSDKEIIRQFLTKQSTITNFNVDNFDNGIFDITVDDYYTFLKSRHGFMMRPLFGNTKFIKFIKYDRYFMFVSVSPKGKYSLLHGAKLRSLKYSLEYYYDRLQRYADAVINRFSKYWAALETISEQVRSLYVDEHVLRAEYSEYLKDCKLSKIPKSQRQSFELWSCSHSHKPSGYIHGCIVDIDYFNHIYLNPYDGKIVPYYADSMYDKDVFENLQSLLSATRPDLLESSLRLIDDKSGSSIALMINNEISSVLVSKNDVINKKPVNDCSTDMYSISNKIKPLKDILDIGWVQVWYDSILGENNLLLEDKYKIKKITKISKK